MRLEATSGSVRYSVTDPAVRAVAPLSSGDRARLVFAYDGPTVPVSRLASGEIRRQICLKLHALDGDNVVYACWTWDPGSPRVWATAKVGGEYMRASAIYYEGDVFMPRRGVYSEIAARLDGDVIRIWCNGTVSLVAEMPEQARGLAGPCGVRTDNARLIAAELSEDL